MSNNNLPFYWANNFWCFDKKGALICKGPIGRRNGNRFDYSSLKRGDSSCSMLKDDYEFVGYRRELKSQIVDELLLEGDPREEPVCAFFLGGTASGKTTMVEDYRDGLDEPHIYINYDLSKTKIPEYEYMKKLKLKYAAEFVQSESAKITASVLKKSITRKFNIVYETTLSEVEMTLERIRQLRRKGYNKLLGFYSFVDVETALGRAKERSKSTGRFVPPDVIKSAYEKVPLNIKILAEELDGFVAGDNRGEEIQVFAMKTGPGKWEFPDSELYGEYIKIVGEKCGLSS